MKHDQETTILIDDENPNRPIECPYCGKVSLLSDLRRRPIDRSFWRLRNREGYEFICPECGSIAVKQFISKS